MGPRELKNTDLSCVCIFGHPVRHPLYSCNKTQNKYTNERSSGGYKLTHNILWAPWRKNKRLRGFTIGLVLIF